MGNGDKRLDKRDDQREARQAKAAAGALAEFRGYLNLELTPEEKSEYDAWADSAMPYGQMLADCQDGVQIAVKWEGEGKPFLASATQRRAGSVNAGLCLTCRGSMPGVALFRLLFSLYVLSDYPKWEDRQRVADPDRW